MYIGYNVWFTFILHQLLTTTATHMASPDLQGYENLIPYSELYESCIEEHLSNCAILLDDVEKRSPQFNAWGGKRAKFSSWGGKRAARQFNSWGGKRATEDEEDNYDEDDSLNILEKRAKFSSWGGKRAKFNSWGGKRASKFSSWGGKRSPELFDSVKRADIAVGYKRKPAFNSWGGKRSDRFLLEDEHSINKRDTSAEKPQEVDEDHMPDLWKEFFDRISNPNFNKKNPYDHPAGTISTIAVPVKKSSTDSHLQQLFKQFVYWTGNRPGEKKDMIMNSKLLKERYSIPMRRGSADFYAWGGKRSGEKTVK